MAEARHMTAGETITTAAYRLTPEEAINFARQFDPQPIHLDEASAANGFFGVITASGWHALALTMRMVVNAHPFGDHPLIGAELSRIRFSRPILPEMELVVRITFDSIEKGAGRHAYNILVVETLDAASGEMLIHQRWRMLRTSD